MCSHSLIAFKRPHHNHHYCYIYRAKVCRRRVNDNAISLSSFIHHSCDGTELTPIMHISPTLLELSLIYITHVIVNATKPNSTKMIINHFLHRLEERSCASPARCRSRQELKCSLICIYIHL